MGAFGLLKNHIFPSKNGIMNYSVSEYICIKMYSFLIFTNLPIYKNDKYKQHMIKNLY
jgi:hypothetical protein